MSHHALSLSSSPLLPRAAIPPAVIPNPHHNLTAYGNSTTARANGAQSCDAACTKITLAITLPLIALLLLTGAALFFLARRHKRQEEQQRRGDEERELEARKLGEWEGGSEGSGSVRGSVYEGGIGNGNGRAQVDERGLEEVELGNEREAGGRHV